MKRLKIIFLLTLTFGLSAFLTSFGPTNNPVDGPKLIKLKISECIEDCEDPDKIFSEDFKDNIYTINFGMLLNCCGQDTLSVKLTGDTLKIKIKARPKYKVTTKNGVRDSVLLGIPDCECDCYFKFYADIKNIDSRPKFVKVNKTMLKTS